MNNVTDTMWMGTLPLQHSSWASLYLMAACAHVAQGTPVSTRHGEWCRVKVNNASQITLNTNFVLQARGQSICVNVLE